MNNNRIHFQNVTTLSGINDTGDSWGTAWGDVNGDGLPDLWVNHHQDRNDRKLYINQGDGTFQDQTSAFFGNQSLVGDFHGAVWLDIDNDGDRDLLQLTGGGSAEGEVPLPRWYEHLYLNENGRLIDRIEGFWGIDYALGSGRTPLPLDINRDGKLDILYTAKPRNDGISPTTVFQQTQTSFTDIGPSLGITTNLEGEVFPIYSDLTGDGKPELILNQKSRTDQLVVYDVGTRPFTNITQQVFGSLEFPDKITDIVTGDFNGDAKIDAYLLTRSGADHLLLQQDGQLVDASETANISSQRTLGKNAVAGDWDNDGDLDLFIVQSGRSRPDQRPTNTPDLILENDGTGRFSIVEAGDAAGTDLGIGDSATVVDFDQDGRLDIFVTNGDLSDAGAGYDTGAYELFQNQGLRGNWVEFDLQGVQTNRDAIGSTVFVTAGVHTQIREQMGGVHARSQNHTRLHFGLADQSEISKIQVNWTSGGRQTHFDQAANRIATLVEGMGTTSADHLIGTRHADNLVGQAGDDRLVGRQGNDSLVGGDGEDTLSGGQGRDRFVFQNSRHGADHIVDFEVTEDLILLRQAGFDLDIAKGELADFRFTLGRAAQDSGDRIIYNQSTGALLFDADGAGTQGAVRIATLDRNLALSAEQIQII